MANATVLSFGQVNGGGSTDAMFLRVFGGEVMAAFETATVMQERHTLRSISSGVSAQFPATWRLSSAYHTPGNEIVGQTSNAAERIINIDDLLICSVFFARLDEAKTHYDVRSIYSTEAGRALGYRMDRNLLQVGCLAARASATVTGANGGSTLDSTGTLYRTSAVDLAAGIYAARQILDEKDIPEGDTSVFVKPAQYYLMAQSTALINRDWGGMGSYSDGKILSIAGMPIVKTNNLPTSNISANTGEKNTYNADFSKTAALVMHKRAIGTVKLLDLKIEMAYDIRRQGHLLVASYAVGHGILRPECAVELRVA